MVGHLPIHLIEQFERESLLPFQPERINRIQLINGRAQHEFLQQAQATVKVSTQLTGNRAIVERLRKFAVLRLLRL